MPAGDPGYRIGIDLGGTKTEGIAMAPDGRELARRRMSTPADDYHGIIETVAALVGELEESIGAAASIGICTPGAVSPFSGLLRNSNTTCLNDTPFPGDLEDRLGRAIRTANDANCFALSEAVDGAGAGSASVFGIILGTGVGGGIVLDGRPLTGRHAIAGEWGHNPLPWPTDDERPGPGCYCGRRGCIETWLAGPGLSGEYRRMTDEHLSAAEIAGRGEEGEGAAVAALERYEERLARALAHVINLVDPDVIVAGGGLSNIRRLYENVPRLWSSWVFSEGVTTRLLPPVHGDAGGARGAAWLWNR